LPPRDRNDRAAEIVLLGRSGGEEITLQDLGRQWEVDVSSLYALIGKSIRRRYVH